LVSEREELKQTKTAVREDRRTEPKERPRKKKKGKPNRVQGYAVADNETNPAVVAKPAAKQLRMPKGYRVADEPLPSAPKELPLDGYVPVGYEQIPVQKVADGEPPPPQNPGMISDFERRYSQRAEETPPPARPLISGVYTFPWYPNNLLVWSLLALAGMAICSLIQVCLILEAQLHE
jgi:hypothetical protein